MLGSACLVRSRVVQTRNYLHATDVRTGIPLQSQLEEIRVKQEEMASKVNNALKAMKIELPLSRHTLMLLCEHHDIGIKLSFLSATEAILFCRGPGMEGSETYDHGRLIKWLMDNKAVLSQ